MRTFLTLALLLAATTTHAQACKLRMSDLSFELKATAGSPAVLTTTRYGAGNEKVNRYTLAYTDGSSIVLEQQDCTDSNLRLTHLSLNEKPTLLELNRLAAVLSATTLWRSAFPDSNAAVLLQTELATPDFTSRFAQGKPFSYAADERIFAPSATSHVSLGFAPGNASTQFRSQLTLTFSVRSS